MKTKNCNTKNCTTKDCYPKACRTYSCNNCGTTHKTEGNNPPDACMKCECTRFTAK